MAVSLVGCAAPLGTFAPPGEAHRGSTSQATQPSNAFDAAEPPSALPARTASPQFTATPSAAAMTTAAAPTTTSTTPSAATAAPAAAAPNVPPSPNQLPAVQTSGPVRANVRGQSPDADLNRYTPGSNDYTRFGMAANEATAQQAQYQAPAGPGGLTDSFAPPPAPGIIPAAPAPGGFLSEPSTPPVELPTNLPPALAVPPPGTTVPWDVIVQEARTGQFMVGVGVNSDAGVTGQIVLDERNFDWRRVPTSWDDILNGTAWRGAGQGFRLEAVPGNQVQRYLVSFTEPYLFDTQVSLNLSGFFYDRRYFDWDEQRLGGRVALGYRLTPDLSFTTALRMENVNIHDPRVVGVKDLDDVIGDNALYSPRFSLTHDTRDVPFLPTEGHYIELSYEQVFGDFDYPRGEIDYRKYFLVTERPDGSGRHTLAFSSRFGFSGSQTPIFENYFAGGYSTLRGFDFRGASPVENTVRVGGEFRMLGAVEYMFPLTADDMIRGVAFVDFGTVEEKIEIEWDDFRVAPGLGLRISIPALGPAPIALDFAVPIAREDTDDIENFSFFFGFGRS